MDDSSIIEKLVLFGLGRQEASVYICLLKNSELTGYEVSKLTGISRSNVYNSLAALVDHGAAYLREGATSRYVAVAMEEFCCNRIHCLTEVKDYLVANCPKPVQMTEGYITIEGYQHILDKIHHMLCGAQQRVYFSASTRFLERWKDEIMELTGRRIKVVLIAEEMPKSFPMEHIIFYQSKGREEEWEEKSRQLRLIIDSAYVLTGELGGYSGDTSGSDTSGRSTCLYSAQKNFVNVFKEAMSNEIKLIELERA